MAGVTFLHRRSTFVFGWFQGVTTIWHGAAHPQAGVLAAAFVNGGEAFTQKENLRVHGEPARWSGLRLGTGFGIQTPAQP